MGNEDSLKNRCANGPKPWFASEHSGSGGCGLTIRAEILPVPSNSLLVQVLNVSVVNQRELIEALGRFEAEIKSAVEGRAQGEAAKPERSEEHTSELQSLMRISYAVFCLKTKSIQQNTDTTKTIQQ